MTEGGREGPPASHLPKSPQHDPQKRRTQPLTRAKGQSKGHWGGATKEKKRGCARRSPRTAGPRTRTKTLLSDVQKLQTQVGSLPSLVVEGTFPSRKTPFRSRKPPFRGRKAPFRGRKTPFPSRRRYIPKAEDPVPWSRRVRSQVGRPLSIVAAPPVRGCRGYVPKAERYDP